MTFRDIKPVRTFDGECHPHLTRQFNWVDDGDSFSTARYAGKEMTVCIDGNEATFRLTYLDMAHPTKFKTMSDAKQSAPDFAKAVLVHMIKMVGFSEKDKDDPALSRL